jgi:Membrane proteins related to metalloendopeptidases
MGSVSNHSTAKVLRYLLIAASAGVAMAVSAVAGAWMQSHFHESSGQPGESVALDLSEARREAGYIRQNVSLLAAKVGDLQARLFALEALGHRVADAAGVVYTDPEVHAALQQSFAEVNPDLQFALSDTATAESLGRELDALERALASGAERLEMLDVIMTQRKGMKEAVPSARPIDYPYLSSSYGWRRHPITGRHAMHEGLDFSAPRGTPIFAASAGVVTEARYLPGYGKTVEINHGNGMLTRYAHASSISVKVGELVTKGQQIARVGSTGKSTGAHLHFEVRVAGHPLDPTLFMGDSDSDHPVAGAPLDVVEAQMKEPSTEVVASSASDTELR